MNVEKLVGRPFRVEDFTADEVFDVVNGLCGEPDAIWGEETIYHVDEQILAEALADPDGYGLLSDRRKKLVEALQKEAHKTRGLDLIFGG